MPPAAPSEEPQRILAPEPSPRERPGATWRARLLGASPETEATVERAILALAPLAFVLALGFWLAPTGLFPLPAPAAFEQGCATAVALLTGVSAFAAYNRWRALGGIESRLVLAGAGPLGLLAVGRWWQLAIEPSSPALPVWTLSFFWVALLAAWTVARVARDEGQRRHQYFSGSFALPAIALAGAVAAAWSLAGKPAAARLDLGLDLTALALAAVGLARSLPRLVRIAPNLLTRTFAIALGGLAFGRLAVLGAGSPPEPVLAYGAAQTALAVTLVILGQILETRRQLVELQRVHRDVHQLRSEVDSRTRELRRADDEIEASARWRERAERQLRMLEVAVETTSVGICITDSDGRIVYANRAEAAIHDYDRDQLIGMPARQFGPPASARKGPLPPKVNPWVRETINFTRQGREIPVRLTSDRLDLGDGRGPMLVTLCEDIRNEMALRQALDRRDRILRGVGQVAETLLSGQRWQGRVGGALEVLTEATGVTQTVLVHLEGAGWPVEAAQEWPPSGPLDRQDLDDDPEGDLLAHLRAELSDQRFFAGPPGQQPEPIRRWMERRRIGSAVILPIRVSPVCRGALQFVARTGDRWSPIEVEALSVAARALSAALRAEHDQRAAKALEIRFQTLVDSASDLIQSVGLDGRIHYANSAWCRTLGFTSGEARSMAIFDAIAPEEREHCRKVLGALAASGEAQRVETVFLARGGRRISVEGNVSVLQPSGEEAATLGIFRDTTERQELERMKEEFLANVSHELRTPLASMLGALTLLESDRITGRPDKVRELLEIASRNGQRLMALVNDLLDLQKLGAGKLRLVFVRVRVGEILEEATTSVAGLLSLHSVRLLCEREPPAMTLLTDRQRVVQILTNVLSNAIKFSPSGGEIRFEAGGRSGGVEFVVTDQGPGIPEEFRDRLFHRFAQADASSTRRFGGSGLGLAISRELVERLGGAIEIDSAEGSGTTVRIRLPRTAPAAVQAS